MSPQRRYPATSRETPCGTCNVPWNSDPCSALHKDVAAAGRRFSPADREAIAAFQRARKEGRPWNGKLPWTYARWDVVRGSDEFPYFGSLYLPVWDTTPVPNFPVPAFHSVTAPTRAGAIKALRELAMRDYGCTLTENPK